MIELERHIEILLLSNDCVIVPGLGGFMAHHVDARYDEEDGTFLPPLRTLGFNPRLTMNDSLLVQSYIEAYDISYPEALRRIEEEISELRQHLENERLYEFNGLGTLHLNGDGNLEFEPCEAGILTPYYYGLSSYEMKALPVEEPNKAEEESIKQEEEEDSAEDTITIKMSWLRNAVAVAAAVVAFFMISTPISNSDATLDVQQSAFLMLPQHNSSAAAETELNDVTATKALAETSAAENTQLCETLAETPVEAKPTFTIVMASQVTQRNAEIYIAQLNKADFTQARLQTSSKTNMLRVVYGTYNSQEEAIDTLRQLRKQSKQFSNAWVMENK